MNEVIDFKDNLAISYQKLKYTIENMDMSKIAVFHKEILLPRSYMELDKELIKEYDDLSLKLLKEFFNENKVLSLVTKP